MPPPADPADLPLATPGAGRQLATGELGRAPLEAAGQLARLPVVVVLDNLRSLQNVGSIFRSADAFCAAGLHLCGFTGRPPHRDIHRAALGAEGAVPWQGWESAAECLEALNGQGYLTLALELTDRAWPLDTLAARLGPVPRPLALVAGNELEGVSPEALALCRGAVVIPQGGVKHSLNVSVATALCLWEARRVWGEPAHPAP